MFASLGQILPRSAARYGSKTALVAGERRLSYANLNQSTNRLANALVALGVRPGDRVTLYSVNGWEWVVAYHAVLKAGAIVNPINVMLTPSEVSYVVNDCGARVIITSADKAPLLAELKSTMPLDHLIVYGNAPAAGAHALDELIGRASDKFEMVARTPEDI